MGSASQKANMDSERNISTVLLLCIFLTLPTTRSETGLLVVGGEGGLQSVEFWAPPPLSAQCFLSDLPHWNFYHSLDSLNGEVILCGDSYCSRLKGDKWEEAAQLVEKRWRHTSVVTSRGLMLLGGQASPNTTELVSMEGGGTKELLPLEPPRLDHCSIQVSEDVVVLTGGRGTEFLVTEHNLSQREARVKQLPSLETGRRYHACGHYTVGSSLRLLVTGGYDGTQVLDSTERLNYSTDEPHWRVTGSLPAARHGLRAAYVAGVLHVTGGKLDTSEAGEVLVWDGIAEQWAPAGSLQVNRQAHAVLEVPVPAITTNCLG